FGLTVEDLQYGISKLRNRVIGRVLHELGLVEQWGSGAQRMIAACKDSGLAPPVWEEIGVRLRVTLHTEQIGPAAIDPIDQAILDVLNSAEGCGTSDIAEKIKRSPRATRTRLAKLVSRGLVREIGTGPKDPKRRYYKAV
ncbi:MAG: winged helix-turn-helix transcriptional regulator, partial [Proteobacteria bacterium]|nr:winged helix-turn-helix transcriptional regulator [Pseudomonadota bacterium]